MFTLAYMDLKLLSLNISICCLAVQQINQNTFQKQCNPEPSVRFRGRKHRFMGE